MSNKPFTIQINSLEALERLIGGSTQAEIDIRNAVVQKFAEKHLKPIAEKSDFKALAERVATAAKDSVKQLVQDQIGTVNTSWSGTILSVSLHEHVRREIDLRVKSQAAALVDAAVLSTLAELKQTLPERISGAVKIRLDYEIGQEVKKQVGEAFRRALEGAPK